LVFIGASFRLAWRTPHFEPASRAPAKLDATGFALVTSFQPKERISPFGRVAIIRRCRLMLTSDQECRAENNKDWLSGHGPVCRLTGNSIAVLPPQTRVQIFLSIGVHRRSSEI
jgi:hypothetical protein